MKKSSVALLIIFSFVLIDQIVKVWVKSTMSEGDAFPVFENWFYISFVQNKGMAFGISLGENIGKLLLSFVRIGVAGFIIYYLFKSIKKKQANWSVVIILSLIIAGAMGNIIDSIFYGWIWNYIPFINCQEVGSYYAPCFYGHVVDMFYFKLFKIPEWSPLWGGEYFFPAIFNVADACTTIGIIAIIIWNKTFFGKKNKDVVRSVK
ncbi:MAG: signal peptidase II [Bacteroidales bacterium]|jgi:signal peptidase II|nr:signal peptidase II [Bacteroidales bacterium]